MNKVFCVVAALAVLVGITQLEQGMYVQYLNQQGYSDVVLQVKWTVDSNSKCLFHNRGQLYSFVAKEGSGTVCQRGFSKVHELTAY